MTKLRVLVALLAFSTVAASAQTADRPPVNLSSSRKMAQDNSGKESWTYRKPGMNLTRYKDMMIDPTMVYNGPDAQFGDISAADRQKFASIITQQLRQELAKSFPIVARPGANTARLRVTLLGVAKTTGGVATATRVLPIGLAVNAVKSIAGKGGSLTGSVLFAVELTDARSGELQVAAVRRQSPNALDVEATLSTTDTVKQVARDMARTVRERLEQATGRAKK